MAVINSQFKFAHLDNRGERELPPPTEWVLPNPPPGGGGVGDQLLGFNVGFKKKLSLRAKKKGLKRGKSRGTPTQSTPAPPMCKPTQPTLPYPPPEVQLLGKAWQGYGGAPKSGENNRPFLSLF